MATFVTPKPDIAVVGGGLAGAAAAWHALRSGARTAWIVGDGVAGSATWASGGMLAPKAEGLVGDLLELGRRALAGHEAFVAEVEATADRSVHRGRGMWVPVCAGDPVDWLVAYAERRQADGDAVAIGDRDDWPTDLPTDALTGAIAYADEGWVDPRGLWSALSEALHRQADLMRIDGEVRKVGAGDDVVLDGGFGRLTAGRAVIAAGHRAAAIGGIDWPRLGPVWGDRGLMLRLHGVAPPPGVLYRHDPRGVTYVVPDPAGVRLGSTSTPHDTRPQPAAGELADLLTRGAVLWPPLARAHLAETTIGWRPCGPGDDDAPYCAPLGDDPRLMGLLGLDRNGILLAPTLAADAVAALRCA